MIQNEALITQWAPALLLMELNNLLWKDADHIEIKKLWDYLCTYCYLPRLASEAVLENTIRAGLNSMEYFAYAAGFDGTRYIDLKFKQFVGIVDRSGYLIKTSAAQKQLAEEQAQPGMPTESGAGGFPSGAVVGGGGAPYHTYPSISDTSGAKEPPAPPKNTHFYMSAQLDNTRINRDVQRLVEEVISHLSSVDGVILCHGLPPAIHYHSR